MNLSNYHKFKRLFVNIKFLKEYHIKTPLFVSLIGVFVKVLNSLMVKIASPFDFCLSGLASPFQLSTNSKTCLLLSTYQQWHIQGFFGKTGTHIEPTRVEKFSKFVHPDTLKMHSLTLSVIIFLCKTFSKLLKLTLLKTLFRKDFLKNSIYSNKKFVWL